MLRMQMQEFALSENWRFVLELNTGTEEEPGWMPLREAVQAYGQALEEESTRYYYMNGEGAPETVTEGLRETFTVTGHRNIGDRLQDWLFAHDRVWNAEPGLRLVPYRYYNTVSGKGETGLVRIAYTTTASGLAQERAVMNLVLTVQGRPEVFELPETAPSERNLSR